MRIFKTKWFVRYARKERISDKLLLQAIERANSGSIDARLGGSVIKQRIERPGRGRSGGYRSIIVFREGERAFFVFGFAKNERDNLDQSEEVAYKQAARQLLALTVDELNDLVAKGTLQEIDSDG